MRIELDQPDQKKKKTVSDNFTPVKDERRTFKSEWNKMKAMGFHDGWSYFWDYYRNTVLLIILAIVIVTSLTITVIRNKRPFVIEINLYNNIIAEDTDTDAFCEAFAEHMGVNLKDYQMMYSASDYFNPEQGSEEMQATVMKFAAMIASSELDIIGGDRTFIDYYSCGEEDSVYFYDLKEVLPDDLYRKFESENRIYFSKYTDEDGIVLGEYPSAIDVSNTRLTETDGGGLMVTPCYVGIACNSTRVDAAVEFLRWIFYMTE